MSYLFTSCRCGHSISRSAMGALVIWVIAMLGWSLLLKMEGNPPWLAVGGAMTMAGGLVVLAKRLIWHHGAAIVSGVILSIGLLVPAALHGLSGIASLAEFAIVAPAFLFLPASSGRDQRPAVFVISSVIGALAIGIATLI